jgi:hypothetical protein
LPGQFLLDNGSLVLDAVTEEKLKRLEAAVAGVDGHFRLSITDDGEGGVTVTILSR